MARLPARHRPNTTVSRDTTPTSADNPLSLFGIDNVTPNDNFSVEYSRGLLVTTVRRDSGAVQTSRRSVDGSFSETTTFDADRITRDERNTLIRRLADGRMTQSEIARRTGVSQATVSNVLRRE
jgi:hypothetical protein